MSLFCLIPVVSAQTEIISVQDLEQQRKQAVEDIERTTELLKETNASAKNSLNRLNLLSQQLMARKKNISLLRQELASVNKKIDNMSVEIDLLDKELTKTKENYAKSVSNQFQEYRTTQHKMLIIMSAEDIAQSYRRMRYLREYADWQKEEAKRITSKQNDLIVRKNEHENLRKEKQILFEQLENENKKLAAEEKEQKREVTEINKKKNNLQAQLQKKKKEADALNRRIDALIAEEIASSDKNLPPPPEATPPANTAATPSKSETAEAKSKETKAPALNRETFVMTESELKLSKDFANNKGLLPFPLAGKYTIVSSFGEHQHQELTYVRTNNNGIDIQTTAGTDARAIFKGVITRVFMMPGFNNNVIIRHGNYLTVYSNLSQVYVKAGDIVQTQQPIGKIFTDVEKGNETILHFQIWKERSKLNPESWVSGRY
jgi:septal ring factor EnvC (AmiA/AmiB activator)